MGLTCPSCSAPFLEQNVDTEAQIAWCESCEHITDLSTIEDPGGSQPKRARPEVPLPAKFTISRSSMGLEVLWRWWSPRYIFLALFCLAWDSFLAVWYLGVFTRGLGPETLLSAVFPLIHVAAGVGITYSTAAGFLNRTRLGVQSGVLSIRHGPLPWGGNQDISTAQLDQLYCKRCMRQNKGSTTVTFELHAVLGDGRQRKLISGLEDATQALWLEQELERYLEIEDRRIGGEMEG